MTAAPRADSIETTTLAVWVQPNASRQRIVGMRGDALKIAVTAPPEKGKANKAVERLLASQFGLPNSAVSVVAGLAARRKAVKLQGVGRRQVAEWLAKNCPGRTPSLPRQRHKSAGGS